MFKALVLEKGDKAPIAGLRDLDDDALPDGNVTVGIQASTLNYKDALAIVNGVPVVRKFPMVPGIDFAGEVLASDDPAFAPGDGVVLNGWGVGEGHWGGLSQKARVKSDWLIPRPKAFTPAQAMAIGTAGYTSMLCVMALQANGITPQDGPILVTGAAGGVGSVAIMLLKKLGYEVAAASRRVDQEGAYLKSLGATQLVGPDAFEGTPRPLAREMWAGAIDGVGGTVLAHVLTQIRYGGTVAACGLAQSMDLPTSVAPFILRGVTLAGVDSVMAPRAKRLEAWARLGDLIDPDQLAGITRTIGLDDVIATAPDFLSGQVRGRIVVTL